MNKKGYEEITKAATLRIQHLAACANAKTKTKDSADTRAHHRRVMGEWAYGAYLLWETLTGGMLSANWEADSERLREMVNAIGKEPGEG